MFKKQDEKYITRLIGRNEVILFLGAGFSLNAKNQLDEKFPTGWTLGQKLWKFLEYEGEYDGSPIALLYQDFIDTGIKRNEKNDFLNKNLLSGDVPKIYDSICLPY